MKYMGSKNRHAKQIMPILMENHDDTKWYIEPFVGGANMIDKIPATKRFGSDYHFYLISMWQGLVSGEFIPPELITEEQYKDIRENKDNYDPALVGFVGFGCSYSGKWFGMLEVIRLKVFHEITR